MSHRDIFNANQSLLKRETEHLWASKPVLVFSWQNDGYACGTGILFEVMINATGSPTTVSDRTCRKSHMHISNLIARRPPTQIAWRALYLAFCFVTVLRFVFSGGPLFLLSARLHQTRCFSLVSNAQALFLRTASYLPLARSNTHTNSHGTNGYSLSRPENQILQRVRVQSS